MSPDNAENEKDLTTEKDKTVQNGKDETQNDDEKVNKSVENGDGDATLNESKVSEAASPGAPAENGDSSKQKPKKEKVKKKWSLRKFSFSKKDKQKPTAKEETATNDANEGAMSSTPASPPTVVNGTECEKVPEEVSLLQIFHIHSTLYKFSHFCLHNSQRIFSPFPTIMAKILILLLRKKT